MLPYYWECHADAIWRYQRWRRDVRQREPSICETGDYSTWGRARRCSERFPGDSMDHKSLEAQITATAAVRLATLDELTSIENVQS
jgi:hypothetical protein